MAEAQSGKGVRDWRSSCSPTRPPWRDVTADEQSGVGAPQDQGAIVNRTRTTLETALVSADTTVGAVPLTR
jgi:hypothetical protein